MRAKSTQSVSRAAVLVGLVLGLAAFDSFAVRAVLLAVCPFVPHRSTSSISIVRFVRRRSRSTPSPRRHASSTSPQSRPRARRPVSSHPRLCRASCVPLRWFLYDWLCAVWLVDFAIARRSLGYVARSIKTARASRCARVGPTGWGVKTLMIGCDGVRCSTRAIRLFEPRTRERWPPRTPRERSRTSPRRSSSSLWRNTSDPPARYAKNRTHDDARASRRDRATTRARERRGDGRSNATTSAVTNANVFVRIDRRRARRRAGVRASTKARDVGVESSARASPRASGAGAVRATARVPSCDVDGRCARSHLCDRVRVRRRACATSRDAGDRDVAIDRRWLRGQPSRARARRGRGESAIVI